MSFLDDFMGALTLSDSDRESLRKKRGFHDGTIQKFGFKSCGAYIKQVVSEFPQDKLRDAKIIDSLGKVSPQLLQPNIIIPYMNKEWEIEKIRPHRYGLAGDGLTIFSDAVFDREKEYVILTEGEFKVIAGHQIGLNIISVPGIGTFVKNHYQDLITFLSGSKVKKIYILYDSEVKDDPSLPKYKRDWKSRFNVEIYACAMAQKLVIDKYDASVCEFPKEWQINGGVDVDSAVASGKDSSAFWEILNVSKSPADYKRSVFNRVTETEKRYIGKRINTAGKEQYIIRWDNAYWAPPEEGSDKKVGKKLSNFVIDISATYYDHAQDELRREVIIRNEFGENTRPRIIDAAAMSSVGQFKTFGYSQGNYMFYGSEINLMQIWEWEFSCDEGKKIYELDHVGKLEGADELGCKDIWITKELMFYGDREIECDENGVFWVDGKGIRVKSLDSGTSTGDAPSGCQIPVLSREQVDFGLIIEHFTGLAGEAGKLLIGWAMFSLVRTYLAQFSEITPYPFLHGEKESGKTTVCQCVMALFGLPDFGATFTDITKVAITRLMSYYSGFPLWIDEFSNEPRVQAYEGHLKSVYNRISSFKGVRQAFGLATYPIRSGLMLSGETKPVTDGVKRRSVFLPMRRKTDSSASLAWIDAMKKKLGYFSYYVLKNRHSLAAKADIEINKFYNAVLENVKDVDLSTLKHYALFAGCYRALIDERDDKFNEWLLCNIGKQIEVVHKDEVYQLFTDMALLYTDGKITKDFFCHIEIDGKSCAAIWLSGVYDKWKEFYSRHKEIHGRDAIKDAIKARPYYVDERRVNIRNSQRRAIIIDLANAPEVLVDLIDSTRSVVERSFF